MIKKYIGFGILIATTVGMFYWYHLHPAKGAAVGCAVCLLILLIVAYCWATD